MRHFFCALLTVSLSVLSANLPEKKEELSIELPTSCHLTPLYISHFRISTASSSPAYIDQLEQVFRNDLAYCGYAYLSPHREECEKMLAAENLQEKFSVEKWRALSLPFVIDAHGSKDKIAFSTFSLSQESIKHFGEISITGNLDIDRRALHRAADGIVKALFNVDGVASKKILFSLQKKGTSRDTKGKWEAEIFECDWDGANVRQVTKDRSYAVAPIVIPTKNKDGAKEFLYVSYKLSQPKIYLGSMLNGSNYRPIELRGNQLLPAVSSDGNMIAFISDASGRADLFIQKLKGENHKPIQLFSFPNATQSTPTFSPDGKSIAFVSDKDGSPRIYSVPAWTNGKRPPATLLTKAYRESTCPCWSHDGKKLVYSAKIDGVRQICLYDFETCEEKQLTTGSVHKENPRWATNDHHIVYNSIEGEGGELFLINLHQPYPMQITSGHGKKQFPAWKE